MAKFPQSSKADPTVVYSRELQFKQAFAMNFEGFGQIPHDYNVKVETRKWARECV